MALQVSRPKSAHRFLTAFRKQPAWPPASLFSCASATRTQHSLLTSRLHTCCSSPGMSPNSMPTKLTSSHMQHPSQSIIPSRFSLWISRSHPSWVKCPPFLSFHDECHTDFVFLCGLQAPEDRSGIQNIAPPTSPPNAHSNLWDLSLNPLHAAKRN